MSVPPALVVAGKDLRERLRDRSALVLGVGAPLLIAAVMSFAFQGVDDFHVEVAVVDRDSSDLSTAFVDVLGSPGLADIVTVAPAADEGAAEAAVIDGDAQAAVVIPREFGDAVAGAEPLPLEVLTSVDADLAGEVVQAIAGSFAAQVDAGRLTAATALAAGMPVSELDFLVAEASRSSLPVTTVQRPSGSQELTMISYYAPAMGMFFVLFAISFGARGWYLEASGGTLERMTAAVRTVDILAGKALAVFAYAAASLATIALVTSLLFGADWGGPLAAGALILAYTLAVVCLTALVTVVARTDRQADGLASMVTFVLALLGGSFVSLSQAPDLLRRLSLLTPNGWASRAFTDLATGDRSVTAVAGPLVAILVFSAVVAGLAGLLASRRRAA